MIEVFESSPRGRNVILTAETFEEAKAQVESMGVVLMEDDSDYVDCADAFLIDGRVVAIQPVGFTLAGPYSKSKVI